jgi:hypothetical protein
MYIARGMGNGHIAMVATLALVGCPRDAGDTATTGHGSTSSPSPTNAQGPTSATASPTGQSPAPSTASPTTEPDIGPPPSGEAGWIGEWISPRCGDRKYSRILKLEKGGVARGSDFVSPCPENVACVWSGIIPFEGSWKLEGDRVTLELRETAYETMKHPPLPTELTWAGAPVGVESGVQCPYRAR